MDNQLIEARKGNLTDAMKSVAAQEGIEGEALRDARGGWQGGYPQ